MTPATLARKVTEHDTVRQWRLDELVRAGYDVTDALVLSGRRDVDLHRAKQLLQTGCPPAKALRILL